MKVACSRPQCDKKCTSPSTWHCKQCGYGCYCSADCQSRDASSHAALSCVGSASHRRRALYDKVVTWTDAYYRKKKATKARMRRQSPMVRDYTIHLYDASKVLPFHLASTKQQRTTRTFLCLELLHKIFAVNDQASHLCACSVCRKHVDLSAITYLEYTMPDAVANIDMGPCHQPDAMAKLADMCDFSILGVHDDGFLSIGLGLVCSAACKKSFTHWIHPHFDVRHRNHPMSGDPQYAVRFVSTGAASAPLKSKKTS